MTTKVILGGNEFVDCASIVAVRGEPLLSVATGPLRVTLNTPAGWPGAQEISIHENELKPGQPDARLMKADHAIVLLVREVPVLVAMADPDHPHEVLVRLDLRPIGIQLFDDADGLHLGTNLYSRNRVSNASTAVTLG